MKIGIMGGTFNPIHNGHLLIGELARDELNLDEIIYMATGSSVHKEGDLVKGSKRFEMINLAIEGNENFSNSDIELTREGNTYTVDTLKKVRKTYSKEELYFIMGDDSLFTITDWVRFDEFKDLANFVILSRGDNSREDIKAEVNRLINEEGMSIIYLKSPIVEISSTDIRDRIKKGKSIKYQVPKKVEEYIYKKGIYNED